MNKTLHKKLTEKHLYAYMPVPAYNDGCVSRSGLLEEDNLRQELTTDLRQPRPEAISWILKMSRHL
jgi:hypothetical protein